MKITLGLLASAIALGTISVASADSTGVCTMEYAPVCGAVQVQCIKAPCYPIYQTFGNACTLKNANNATYVKNGECGTKLEGAPVILSERLRTSLTAQYQAFATRISSLTSEKQVEVLQSLVTRIDARESQLMLLSSLTIEKRDKLFAALALLRDLAKTDITALQNIIAGAKYVSRDPSQCMLMDYLCANGTKPFTDETGCGCKS